MYAIISRNTKHLNQKPICDERLLAETLEELNTLIAKKESSNPNYFSYATEKELRALLSKDKQLVMWGQEIVEVTKQGEELFIADTKTPLLVIKQF